MFIRILFFFLVPANERAMIAFECRAEEMPMEESLEDLMRMVELAILCLTR